VWNVNRRYNPPMPNRAEAVELVRIARELHNWVNRRY
jgi:hypothetical protein